MPRNRVGHERGPVVSAQRNPACPSKPSSNASHATSSRSMLRAIRGASVADVAGVGTAPAARPSRRGPKAAAEPRADEPESQPRTRARQSSSAADALAEEVLGVLAQASAPMGARAIASQLGVPADRIAAPLKSLRDARARAQARGQAGDHLRGRVNEAARVPAAGAVLGERYRLERELGAGGMGTVWEAVQLDLGRRVAVKLLHARHAGDTDLRERFFREARALAALGQPGIVTILDFAPQADPPYLVMERLVGESLRARLAREAKLPIAEAVCIARAVLRRSRRRTAPAWCTAT